MTVGILLVGGFGTRLMALTKNSPKPMLTVAGLPVTEHQLAMAKRAGITTIVLATSYLSEVFTPYFGDGSRWGMKIMYAVETKPLGTGGAIRNAAKLLPTDQSVVVFNGDVLSSHNLSQQIKEHELNKMKEKIEFNKIVKNKFSGKQLVEKGIKGKQIAIILKSLEEYINKEYNMSFSEWIYHTEQKVIDTLVDRVLNQFNIISNLME